MSTSGPNELAVDVDQKLEYTNRVLSQAEGIGWNFYTLNFARFACADVHISHDGQRVFNTALLNIPRWACLDERLQFGFGDKHLLRNAGVQLYEYEHLLLASALSEFFSEDYAAAVFTCLGDYYEDEDRPKPQWTSFRRFVQGANGILASSKFPLIVDDRIRTNPYQDHDRGMPHATKTTEFVPIRKVAEAIRMLGQLKLGQINDLTFIGGDVVGWFSAFIEVFLNIGQTLIDKDGNILYQHDGQNCTVNLQYVPPDVSETEENPGIIWLRRPLNTAKRSDEIPPIMTGRVVGEALFSKVFGPAFHKLDQKEARSFGNALGGLARCWECWVHGETASPAPSALETDPGSWGLGLIQTWTNWFPELRHLQGRMERALKNTNKEASKMCEESIVKLEPVCGCYICSETKGSEENPTNLPSDDFCLPTMMETIIVLGLSLGRVTLVPDLFPSRAGILAIYKAQVQRRLEIKKPSDDPWSRFKILFGEDWNSTTTKRLRNIVTIFSGSRPTADLPDNLMAISHEGMCAYIMKLQRGDAARPVPDDKVIRVLPGHINWRQKIYHRLCVGPVQPIAALGAGWESVVCDHFEDKLYVK